VLPNVGRGASLVLMTCETGVNACCCTPLSSTHKRAMSPLHASSSGPGRRQAVRQWGCVLRPPNTCGSQCGWSGWWSEERGARGLVSCEFLSDLAPTQQTPQHSSLLRVCGLSCDVGDVPQPARGGEHVRHIVCLVQRELRAILVNPRKALWKRRGLGPAPLHGVAACGYYSMCNALCVCVECGTFKLTQAPQKKIVLSSHV
jgi:hypothetical protein